MKRTTLTLFILFSIFSLVCCGDTHTSEPEQNQNNNENNDDGNNGNTDNTPHIISISANSEKLVYQVGDEFDLDYLTVTSLYSDDTTQIINLSEVSIYGFDSTVGHESLNLTISYQTFSCSLAISVEYPSPFKSLKSEDPFTIYHDGGGFDCSLYYNAENPEIKRFFVAIDDYSLGSIASSGLENATISSDYHTLSFYGASLNSKFFQCTKEDLVVFEHDRYDDSIKMTVNENSYNLVREKVTRNYYLEPNLVGKWEIEGNIVINITNRNFEPEINISENDVNFTTTLSHSESGTLATLHGEVDGTILRNGMKILFYYNQDGHLRTATIGENTYELEEYVDKDIIYDEEYFYITNCPNNVTFSNGNVTLTSKNVMGNVARFMNINEGDYENKSTRWTYKNNGATLEATFSDSNKTAGIFKNGVTYTLSAVIENEQTIIRLTSDDGLNLVMTRGE